MIFWVFFMSSEAAIHLMWVDFYLFFNTLILTWAQNYNASLTVKVDLNLRFSLKSTKVYYNRFSYFKVDLNLRKYLNI